MRTGAGGEEMTERLIRTGKVSTVDYENGTISVTYPALDNDTTDKLPVFSMADEYKMPAVGQDVLVLHMPTGQSAGIVLGRMWNEKNPPRKYGEHVYSQEFGSEPEEAYMEYDGADGDLKFKDKNTGPVTLTELLGLAENDKHIREFGDEPGEAYIEYRPEEGRLYFKDKRAGLASLSTILGLSEEDELKDPDPDSEPDPGEDPLPGTDPDQSGGGGNG